MRHDITQASFSLLLGLATIPAMAAPLMAGETPAPEGATVYFIAPGNGEIVSSPVGVVFGLKGMGVAPAGADKQNTGHHHILVDRGVLMGEELDYSIPADENHVHFGGGQTETLLDLPPGEHTLQLVLGDMNHVPTTRL